MRLNEIKVPTAEEDQLASKIVADCQQYFALSHNRFVFHGASDRKYPSLVTKANFEARRRPRDTDSRIHEEVNEYFVEKFGKPFRNALFATGNQSETKGYGTTYYFLPIGRFEWLCYPYVTDLTNSVWDLKKSVEASIGHSPDINELNSELVQYLDDSMVLHNKNLPGCIESQSEIMFWCEKFYLIKWSSKPDEDISGLIQSIVSKIA